MEDARGVLFVDVSDSTRLYRVRGDEAGHQVLSRCLDILSRVVEACDGNVVDRIGDELMCTFNAAGPAARAAVELQRAISNAKFDGRLPKELNVRIGLHYGPLGIDGERIFGETVHTAKRMVSRAKAQQILATGASVDALSVLDAPATRHLERTRVKGQTEKIDVYEVVWDLDGATKSIGATESVAESVDHQLTLRYGDVELVLDPTRPVLTIGRDGQCDVVVDQPEVSRFHARIERHQGRFTLTDTSINGTEIHHPGGHRTLLRRDARRLSGEGYLILGREESGKSPHSIAFRCAAAPSTDEHSSS